MSLSPFCFELDITAAVLELHRQNRRNCHRRIPVVRAVIDPPVLGRLRCAYIVHGVHGLDYGSVSHCAVCRRMCKPVAGEVLIPELVVFRRTQVELVERRNCLLP